MRPRLLFPTGTCNALRLSTAFHRHLRWPASVASRPASSTSGAAPEKLYYITTPIFYVNAAPHVGHLYTMVLADILKRWQQLEGRPAKLCTGTDEHGMKIQQAALLAGSSPKAFCDAGAGVFKNLAGQANISHDTFIRTTDLAHYDAVQYFWQMLTARDYIYTGKHEGWYSVADETFYPAGSIEHTLDLATGRKIVVAKETGTTVEWTSETNYHFRLSKLAPRLLEFYKEKPEWIYPKFRHAEVVAIVEAGLEDLSVSRPHERLQWGVPVPTDPTQTIYVWLDALVNYISASGYPWTPDRESLGGWPVDVHVIGKDIIKFHCVYWPAFLLALDIPLPSRVLTHAHWTMNRRKMSKTVGNVVNPFYAMSRFGVDTLRFYMAHDGGIADDGDYSNESIVHRYKHSLQGGLGNLLGRICGKNFDIVGGRQQKLWVSKEDRLSMIQKEEISRLRGRMAQKMENLDIPGALKDAMAVVYETNRYLQHTHPWSLKAPEEKPTQSSIIYLAAEGVRVAAILLQPFMPQKMEAALDLLNVAKNRRTIEFAELDADDSYGEGIQGTRPMLFSPISE